MSVVVKQGTVAFGPNAPPDITAVTAVHHFRNRAEALQHLQQYPEQIDGQWFIGGWHDGRGLGFVIARCGWIQE